MALAPPGEYTYAITFTLLGGDRYRVLSARLNADNNLVRLVLNGNELTLSGSDNYLLTYPVNAFDVHQNFFRQGPNELVAVVKNAGDQSNPTGFVLHGVVYDLDMTSIKGMPAPIYCLAANRTHWETKGKPTYLPAQFFYATPVRVRNAGYLQPSRQVWQPTRANFNARRRATGHDLVSPLQDFPSISEDLLQVVRSYGPLPTNYTVEAGRTEALKTEFLWLKTDLELVDGYLECMEAVVRKAKASANRSEALDLIGKSRFNLNKTRERLAARIGQ